MSGGERVTGSQFRHLPIRPPRTRHTSTTYLPCTLSPRGILRRQCRSTTTHNPRRHNPKLPSLRALQGIHNIHSSPQGLPEYSQRSASAKGASASYPSNHDEYATPCGARRSDLAVCRALRIDQLQYLPCILGYFQLQYQLVHHSSHGLQSWLVGGW